MPDHWKRSLNLECGFALEVGVPYGMCVISGAVAGVISMAVLVHTESPRMTPMPIADVPLGTSVASQQTVTLEHKTTPSAVASAEANVAHDASLMFDSARPEVVRPVNATELQMKTHGVSLPLGERVRVHYGDIGMWRAGVLEAADDHWIQLLMSDGVSRTWVARQDVRTIDTIQATTDVKNELP
jgi:hypothetical protein